MARLVERYECEICEMAYCTEDEADRCCGTPQVLDKPNVYKLRALAERHIADLKEDIGIKDFEQECYEVLMRAFYGPDVFKWINKQYGDGE